MKNFKKYRKVIFLKFDQMKHPRVFHKKFSNFFLALNRPQMSQKFGKRSNFPRILAFKQSIFDLNVDILDFEIWSPNFGTKAP